MYYLLLVVFIAIVVDSVTCLYDPEKAISNRRKWKLPKGFLTGEAYYATPKRARVSAAIVLVLALLGLVAIVDRIIAV
jgi:hypothetical protein